jgi:hypothetical protein
MTIVQHPITAISTSPVRLLAQLRESGHLRNRAEGAERMGACTDEPHSTTCVDPGPSGFDFSDDEAKRVLPPD